MMNQVVVWTTSYWYLAVMLSVMKNSCNFRHVLYCGI